MATNSLFLKEETARLSYNMNDWHKRTKALAFLLYAIHHFVQQSYVTFYVETLNFMVVSAHKGRSTSQMASD